MPLDRRLAFRDRYVWNLSQTISGGSSDLPPVVFIPDTPVRFVVEWTEQEFTEVFSALLTGADLTYPEKSHAVVWNLLKQVEYPLPFESPPSMLDLTAYTFNGVVSAGTFTYSAVAALPFGFTMFSDTTAGRQIRNTVWLRAGEYSYTGGHTLGTTEGEYFLEVYDASNTNLIDTIASGNQYGTFGTRVLVTGVFTIPSDGFYVIRVRNPNSFIPPSTAFRINWSFHNVRQTA